VSTCSKPGLGAARPSASPTHVVRLSGLRGNEAATEFHSS